MAVKGNRVWLGESEVLDIKINLIEIETTKPNKARCLMSGCRDYKI